MPRRNSRRRSLVDMHKTVVTTAAIVAAVVVLWVAAWPRRPDPTHGTLDPRLQQRTISGALHVHSLQSDGSGTRAEIAAAAARARLQFVVFTDHGDATRGPDPPTYSSGVLCVDAVEISTNSGHYVALGLGAAPYRLGGEAAAVVEDVHRLGGFGIVAHPDSPKPALAWRDWSVEADGVEWLNADSEWRNESWPSLVRTLLGYSIRPAAALASILDREALTIDRWDNIILQRPMVAVGAHDAHGGPGRSKEESGRTGLPRVPSYEASFKSFSQRIVLRSSLTGDAATDADALLEGLRAGRTYTVIDARATPGWLDFTAERGNSRAGMGQRLEGEGPARLLVRAPVAAGSRIRVLREGQVVAEADGGEVSATTSKPGAYRVEVRLSDSGAPWIFSNPIYIGLPSHAPPAPIASVREVARLPVGDWRFEHDPASTAGPATDGRSSGLAFKLGETTASPFAALVASLPQPVPAFDAVVADLVSTVPLRISVQFRTADGSARWGRSIYVGPGAQSSVLPISDFRSAERDGKPFEEGTVSTILLVVDLVNAVPGASSRFLVRRLALASQAAR